MGRREGRAAARAALLLVVLTAIAGCAAEGASSAPSLASTPTAPSSVTGAPRDVVTGLAAPWSITWVDDTALVSERDSGRILEITADGVREVAVVDGVAHGGEGGLLGLAARGDDLYVYSTADDGNRVQRFPLTGDAGALGLGDPTTIIDALPAAGNHNAGRIAFGPDGMLYVPVGDAGRPDTAQDPDSLGGKILRLTPEGGIPADNPTEGSPVYTLGHRNVQGIAWSADGRMFASEFGQNTLDELNEIVAGGNYGWPIVEGTGGTDEGFVDPLQEWTTDSASPSGIAVIGETIYLANLRGERLRAVPLADPSTSVEYFTGEYGRIRDAVATPDGELWLLTNNTDGRGDARDGDDRILAVSPATVSG